MNLQNKHQIILFYRSTKRIATIADSDSLDEGLTGKARVDNFKSESCPSELWQDQSLSKPSSSLSPLTVPELITKVEAWAGIWKDPE